MLLHLWKTTWQKFPKEIAVSTEFLFFLPGMEVKALTNLSRKEPTDVPLPCLVDQTFLTFSLRTLDGFPACVATELRPMSTGHQEKEGCLLHRRTWIPPPLLTALHCAKRYAKEVRKL